MKVSAIVAAYNAEKYLSETLNSLIHQTLDDYEIIVVNDGSVDNTLNILMEYKEQFKELHIINQENSGPSVARNAALDVARGEYILFSDADDIVAGDAMEKLYNRAVSQKSDLVIAKYDIFSEYSVQEVHNLDAIIKQNRIAKYDKQILWTFSCSNKFFRREFLNEHNIRFPVGISYSEDGVFVMNSVYHADVITGIDLVVFHYRKFFYGEADSITASVNPRKVRDYINAHERIILAAEESWLRDNPGYTSIEELRKAIPEANDYLNEISFKEVQILFNQFYSKAWELDDETIQLITNEMNKRFHFMDIQRILQLQRNHPQVSVKAVAKSHEEILKHAHFSVALYGEQDQEERFLQSLGSLVAQNLLGIKIYLPLSMEASVKNAGLKRNNMYFIDVKTEKELFCHVIDVADTPYVCFCNPRMVYVNTCFKTIFQIMNGKHFDFVSQTVCHKTYDKTQPLYYSNVAYERWNSGREPEDYIYLDYLLGNKFFRVAYMRTLKEQIGDSIFSDVEYVYRHAYFTFRKNQVVVFDGDGDAFCEYIKNDRMEEILNKMFEDVKITSLSDKELKVSADRISTKLIPLKNKKFSEKLMNKLLDTFRSMKLKDQVLFVSIRKDGELEGNAKALYPHIKGKKVICAKMLPHNNLTKAIMSYRIATSKVIVTDDYLRYLRHFTLKPEQKVIQLWHACGAFKMFGRHGGNLSERVDIATHAQYNLVCVSADEIRRVYADAFDISFKKVQALGVPRTDVFFDEEYIKACKEKVYTAYPMFRDKQIIIYAPTFRDTNGTRSEFKPELNFERLSKNLLPNQVFVICPHPVMKNDIVDKDYNNIKVVRDISTNDMMFVSDMLITDYSSVIFEYALLNKPMAFFCYDLDLYDRGFYLNYPEDLPGDVLKTEEELFACLKNIDTSNLGDKFARFKKNYMSACDGHSSERIAHLINSYMEE